MFGFKIISKKLYNEANEELKSAAKTIEEQTAKIAELRLKLYLQTIELNEVKEQRNTLLCRK